MRQIPYSHSTKSSQMPEIGWPVVGGGGPSLRTDLKIFVNIARTLSHFIIFGLASVHNRDIYTSINWDPRNPM